MNINMYLTSYVFNEEIPELDIEFPDIEGHGCVGEIELPEHIKTLIQVIGVGFKGNHPPRLVCVSDPLVWLATDEGEDIEVNGYNLKDLVRKGCEEFKDDLKEYKLK